MAPACVATVWPQCLHVAPYGMMPAADEDAREKIAV
jgi:hypothetical protein